MRIRSLSLSVTLALASLLAAAAPAAADGGVDDPTIPSLSNSQLQRLAQGEVLVNVVPGEVPVGDAIGIVNAPPAQIMQLLQDFDHYKDWMDDIDTSEVVGHDGDYTLCHGVTDTPWPMSDREWTTRSWGGPRTIDGMDVLVATWSYVPGSGNIRDTHGYWLAIPWGDDGNQTLLCYHLSVDLGTWLPDFLLEWSTENFLPAKINDVRHRLGV
jgi:hypothetical protein